MKSFTLQLPKTAILSKINLVAVFCVSACLLSGIRAFSPLIVGSDSSAQIGAALGLLEGKGLGNYILGIDVAQLPQTELLTWFAPALSLFLFAFLKLGFSTDVGLKIIYAAATIVGWFGWGKLFREVMVLANTRNLLAELTAIVSAIVLPLYFTFDWCGTDLLLWAGIPFVIYYSYLYQHSDRAFLSYIKLGSLIGFLYTIRYAAVFLLIGQIAFLISVRKLRKIFYVVLGFLIFYIPVSVFRASSNAQKGDHVSIASLFNPQLLIERAKLIVSSLKKTEFLFFSHLTYGLHAEKVTAILAVAAIISAIVLIVKRQQDDARSNKLPILLKEILFVNTALIVFLISVSFASSNDFLHIAEIRYYYPLFPSLLLGAYGVAFCFGDSSQLRLKIARTMAGLYLGIFLLGTLKGVILDRKPVFGFHYFSAAKDLVEYPSRQILTRHPESYKALIKLLETNPDRIAISFAEDFDFRHTPNPNIRQRIFPASSTTVPQNTTSKLLKIYAIFAIDSQCPSYCYYESGKEATFLKSLPDVKEYVNSQEKIQIVSATLAKDSKFRINYNVGS